MNSIKTIKTDTDLYFVAIIPPKEILAKVKELKISACENYNSCAALKSPPHITLHMPFRWKKKKQELLLQFFDDFQPEINPFQVEINSVDHFGDRVIFLAINQNEILAQLQSSLVKEMKRKLNLFNADYKDRAFHPHITIAFRDLKKKYFKDALSYFQSLNYRDNFVSDRICLMKHDGKEWLVYRQYSF